METTTGNERKRFFMDSRLETTSVTPTVVSNGMKGKQCKIIVFHQNICSLSNRIGGAVKHRVKACRHNMSHRTLAE
jgi:hypothetical protein